MTRRTGAVRAGTRIDVAAGTFRGPVRVRDGGPSDAPAVLLVHGFCGSCDWYDPVAAELTGTFRVVRLDLLGHGGTGGPPADAPLQARVVDAVLERLGVRHAVAVGHSFGADVVAELAERSTRVDRVVVVCQAPDYTDAQLPPGRALMTMPLIAPVLHGVARTATRVLGAVAAVRPPRDPKARLLARRAFADFRDLDTAMFRVVLVQRRDRMARRPLDAQLRDAGKPALVVLGGQDHFYGDRSAGRYRAAGARVEVLPESGHSPLVDAPARLAELVRDFASVSGRTSP